MRRVMSVILVGALALTSLLGFSFPSEVYGADNDSKDMEKAILTVKSIVKIPEKNTEFQYSYVKASKEEDALGMWRLSWRNKEGDSNVTAAVDDSGMLISFSQYNDEKNEGIGKLKYEEGVKIATDFLKKANPTLAGEMKLEKNINYGDTNAFSYHFSLYKNQIPVDFVKASIVVDKFSSRVISYDFQGDSRLTATFPGKEGIKSLDEIKSTYINDKGIELKYFYNFNKKISIFPAFEVGDSSKALDAKTGKTVVLNKSSFPRNALTKDVRAETAAGGESSLTPEEQAAVTKLNTLMSREKAEQTAKSFFAGFNCDGSTIKGTLHEDLIDKGEFYWTIAIQEGFIKINAKTSEIMAFSVYNESNKKGTAIDEKTAQVTAEAFIKNTAKGDKWDNLKLKNESNVRVNPTLDYIPQNYNFFYTRQANGISFDANGINVTVDCYTGKVTGYNCNWYGQIAFPTIEKAILPEKAFDVFNEDRDFQLMYIKDENKEIQLVYKFSKNINFVVDSFSSAKLGYDGKPYTETAAPTYTDLAGHWSEATVMALKDNGYYLKGTKFNPNEKITQEDFLRYLYTSIESNYDTDEFYKMLVREGIILENEKASSKELTRQGAAKIAVRYLGQDKAAKFTGIYKNVFKDTVDAEYVGYAALSNAFGIIKGDKNGKFLGKNLLSNAEAASIIYKTLEAK